MKTNVVNISRNKNSLAERLSNLSSGRDEMNLCELPFALLSERNSGKLNLEFEVQDREVQSGNLVSRKLIVTGDPNFGLPTAKDEEVYLGLLKYTHDFNGFSDPDVYFSRGQFLELLGWRKSDWGYARLLLGMQRLVGVRLNYQKLWRDNRNKQWRDRGAFSILESFRFRDSRNLNSNDLYEETHSTFRWSSVLFDSFDSGYLKRLDYGLVRELDPTSRRLYRYLDKHFHPPKHTKVSVDLAKLAYQHIGISRTTSLDKVRKRYLIPAVERLTEVGFLVPAATEQVIRKVRRGVWTVEFEKQVGKPKIPSNTPEDQLQLKLKCLGISTRLIDSLFARYSLEQIFTAQRAMDEQVRKGVSIRSPNRWIETALENGFQPTTVSNIASRPERKIYRAER